MAKDKEVDPKAEAAGKGKPVIDLSADRKTAYKYSTMGKIADFAKGKKKGKKKKKVAC